MSKCLTLENSVLEQTHGALNHAQLTLFSLCSFICIILLNANVFNTSQKGEAHIYECQKRFFVIAVLRKSMGVLDVRATIATLCCSVISSCLINFDART